MAKLTKKQQAFAKTVDTTKTYTVADAVKALTECPSAKFDETVEMAFNLNVDPKYADQIVRGTVALPHGLGKEVRVVVFAKDDAAKEAKAAGADAVGDEDLAKKIEDGWMDFDRVIAAPDCMITVGKLGKVLGPRGLMPNPKLGTVTPDVGKVVKDVKSGLVEFKCEKNGVVHTMAGKKSMGAKKLEENVSALIKAIKDAKPSGAKGIYMEGMFLTSTMGPGIELDLTSA
jgi:large subunit ribosomal protein L1